MAFKQSFLKNLLLSLKSSKKTMTLNERKHAINSEVARRLVIKRTKVLRRMIPGGELLDEISLLHEAMDYVVHLHAQVDVLRRVTKAVWRSNKSSEGFAQLKEGTIQISGL
uniref:BHLH domain-containing protein n=1 Tax=Leersia perrieri TaxID=77586 RepID=A0A0D9VCX2_9ORYZ